MMYLLVFNMPTRHLGLYTNQLVYHLMFLALDPAPRPLLS